MLRLGAVTGRRRGGLVLDILRRLLRARRTAALQVRLLHQLLLLVLPFEHQLPLVLVLRVLLGAQLPQLLVLLEKVGFVPALRVLRPPYATNPC